MAAIPQRYDRSGQRGGGVDLPQPFDDATLALTGCVFFPDCPGSTDCCLGRPDLGFLQFFLLAGDSHSQLRSAQSTLQPLVLDDTTYAASSFSAPSARYAGYFDGSRCRMFADTSSSAPYALADSFAVGYYCYYAGNGSITLPDRL